MKLLLSETTPGLCEDIMRKLLSAGINSQIRQKSPSLFDSANTGTEPDQQEVWITNNEDFEKANSILYPPGDTPQEPGEDKD